MKIFYTMASSSKVNDNYVGTIARIGFFQVCRQQQKLSDPAAVLVFMLQHLNLSHLKPQAWFLTIFF